MIGRAAYSNPFLFAAVDHEFFGEENNIITREDVTQKMASLH